MRCTGSIPRPRSILATRRTWPSSARRMIEAAVPSGLTLTVLSQIDYHAIDRVEHDLAALGVVVGLNRKNQGFPAAEFDVAGERLHPGNAPGLRAYPAVQRS